MSTDRVARPGSAKVVPMTTSATNVSHVLQERGYGALPFIGTEDGFYERHLVFDRAIDPKAASARERFEAFSHSVRDVLAQRWVQTKNTYERQNAKRVYYLSMEFLIGRSLANNVTNLLLDPLLPDALERTVSTGLSWSSRNRMLAWATEAWAAWPRAFSTRWRPCSSLARAMVSAMSTACSSNRSWMAGKKRILTIGFATAIPGKLRGFTRKWKSS